MQIQTRLPFVQREVTIPIKVQTAIGIGLGYWLARGVLGDLNAHLIHSPSGKELASFYVDSEREAIDTIQEIAALDFDWNRPIPSLKSDPRFEEVARAVKALFEEGA